MGEFQAKDWLAFPVFSILTKGLEKTSILVYPSPLGWLGNKENTDYYWEKDWNYWPVAFLNGSDIECYMMYAQLSASRRH